MSEPSAEDFNNLKHLVESLQSEVNQLKEHRNVSPQESGDSEDDLKVQIQNLQFKNEQFAKEIEELKQSRTQINSFVHNEMMKMKDIVNQQKKGLTETIKQIVNEELEERLKDITDAIPNI